MTSSASPSDTYHMPMPSLLYSNAVRCFILSLYNFSSLVDAETTRCIPGTPTASKMSMGVTLSLLWGPGFSGRIQLGPQTLTFAPTPEPTSFPCHRVDVSGLKTMISRILSMTPSTTAVNILFDKTFALAIYLADNVYNPPESGTPSIYSTARVLVSRRWGASDS
ncbi:hypothetical protein ONZ45_g7436 [Pleurotus djamor]|nr:hypothetical protein ONZ45_g7436 [Pleurotus djamor]